MSATPVQVATAAVARAARARDPEALADARRTLTAAMAEQAIRRALAAAPPLTDEQRERLAALLRAPKGGARA
jgi:ABC-type branched-subunit amino acid transport system substrate-binding protein